MKTSFWKKEKQVLDTNANIGVSCTNFSQIAWANDV
jgi:hypothetical protein